MTCKDKQTVETTNGPQAIGPYSVGVLAGPFIFTSGQLGIVPETGTMIEGGVEAETRQALENLKVILDAGNSCLENVVKTTVFMRDMGDFAKMNAVYAEFFSENPPARSAVQVAALPKNAAVEIEAIALTNKQ
jgi:2-iminobutanoate/2-iminopropanoate deaminase